MDFLHYGLPREKRKENVVITESTKKVLEEENVVINDTATTEEIVEQVNKTKKAVARKTKNKVVVKRSLNG